MVVKNTRKRQMYLLFLNRQLFSGPRTLGLYYNQIFIALNDST